MAGRSGLLDFGIREKKGSSRTCLSSHRDSSEYDMSAISALIRFRISRIDFHAVRTTSRRSYSSSPSSFGVRISSGPYPIRRFTASYWRIRCRFTMCRKFQLARTSTAATVARGDVQGVGTHVLSERSALNVHVRQVLDRPRHLDPLQMLRIDGPQHLADRWWSPPESPPR